MPWKTFRPDARRRGEEAMEALDACCSGECAFVGNLWSERFIAELRGAVKAAAGSLCHPDACELSAQRSDVYSVHALKVVQVAGLTPPAFVRSLARLRHARDDMAALLIASFDLMMWHCGHSLTSVS